MAAVIVGALGCSAPGGTPARAPSPVALAGCYVVAIGPWAETGGAMGLVPAERFRLDTIVVPDSLSPVTWYRLEPQEPLPSRDARQPTWRPGSADSLTAAWFNGYALGTLSLRVRGDSVRGVAGTRSDVRTGYPDPTAPVVGRRVPCAGNPRG